jgi:fatty acid desaturase
MRLFDGLAHAATQNGATVDAQRSRPDPLRWIWYAFGGTLGPRYRQWVLQDLTGRTRWERQIVRAVAQVAPLAAVVLLALGFGWIAWVGVGCGVVLALIYSLAYFDPSVEHRLAKYGYAPGTAHRILSERDNVKHPDRMRHYMEMYRANTLDANSAQPDA